MNVVESQLALHKFGGSSLADNQCYLRVANLLLSHANSDDLVVVSAAGKTTNKLLKLTELARQGVDFLPLLSQLKHFQTQLIEQLITQPQSLLTQLTQDFGQLTDWLQAPSIDVFDGNSIVGFGEVWSSRLLAALLAQMGRASIALDARDFLVASGVVNPIVDEAVSSGRLVHCSAPFAGHQRVITGFICANEQQQTLLLGRNGSDYSATLIAKLAGAKAVNIWTDVAGVFSADPNLIKEAALIEQLSLAEAQELARLGNPVLHHRTLAPLVKDNIALRVRSSFTPQAAFTEIGKRLGHVGDCIVNGSQDTSLYLFKRSDANQRLVTKLENNGFFPLLVSEHNGQLLVVLSSDVCGSFDAFLQAQNIDAYTKDEHCGVISLLDAGVSWYRKLFTKIFAKESQWPLVLSDNGLSLSVIVPERRVNLLAYLLHQKIYSPSKRIGVALMGAGNIGQQWLNLFQTQRETLENEFNLTLPLVAIGRSAGSMIDFGGIEFDNWQANFDSKPLISQSELVNALQEHSFDDLIVLDISADQGLTDLYPQLLNAGFHVVSANKLAGSAPLAFYKEVKQLAHSHNCKWLYNASVGAGLPILHSINDLHRSGDTIESISGVFSGTLSWLFENYDNQQPFSQLLLKALSLGITEPDPRDDLSGKDKQRKLLILARECGFDIELDDIAIESMVPQALRDIPLQEFLARVGEMDEVMSAQFEQASARNEVVRYVAQFTCNDGKLSAGVGLQRLANDHALASLTPSDNVFLVQSRWYQDNPLIIRGPGAGREVTAAAVQSDLFSILKAI